MTTVRKSIKSEKLKFSMFYGFGNLLCVMEITGTINTKKNEGDDMRVHFDSKSVYASASDFGWF